MNFCFQSVTACGLPPDSSQGEEGSDLINVIFSPPLVQQRRRGQTLLMLYFRRRWYSKNDKYRHDPICNASAIQRSVIGVSR